MTEKSRLRTWLRPIAQPIRKLQHRAATWLNPLSPSKVRETLAWMRRFARERSARRHDNRLTVAIDITPFWEPLTGVGWYLYRLIESLAEHPELSLRLYGPSIMDSPDLAQPLVPIPKGPAIDWVLYKVPIHGMMIDGGRFIRTLRKLEPWLIAREKSKVLFAPNYFLPQRFDLARGTRVAMIHDLAFRKLPWAVEDQTCQRLEEHLEKTIEQSQHFITPSFAVRQELIDDGLLAAAQVTAIHHGPGQIATTPPTGLPRELDPHTADSDCGFALHVGTIEPRKNLSFLLDVWDQLLSSQGKAPHLVLCGRMGWKNEEIAPRIEQGQQQGWLTHLGYVDEGQLSRLYRDARMVVLPTLYEGFGLPAIEALSTGTPLICSDIPVLREVAENAALYATPTSVDQWCQQVQRLSMNHDPQASDRTGGKQRAAAFDWKRTGIETLKVWHQALERES